MGIFSAIFGVEATLSQEKHSLTVREVRTIVSRVKTNTLSAQEEQIIEEAIIAGRDNFSKISLYRIDLILKELQQKNNISIHDRNGVFRQFQKHFKT